MRCDVRAKAEETVEHRSHTITYHNQTAATRWVKLTIRLMKEYLN